MVIKKKVCKLTPAQDRFWERAFTDYMNDGDSEKVADKKAFRDTKKRFSSLRKCTQFK